MEFSSIPEFDKDVKRFKKRFRTIEEDLDVLLSVLRIRPDQRPPFSQRIEGLGIRTCMIKVRKIACRSLKGRGAATGFRMVYAYFPEEQRIVFVELYFKAEQVVEDRERIYRNFQ